MLLLFQPPLTLLLFFLSKTNFQISLFYNLKVSLYCPKDPKFLSICLKYFIQFFANYFLHLNLPPKIHPTPLLQFLYHFQYHSNLISKYWFHLLRFLLFLQDFRLRLQISISVFKILQFMTFNLKFTLLLILVFADFKVDHLHLFRKSIADYLVINLNLQLFFLLFQFLFQVSTVLFLTKWFFTRVPLFQFESSSNLILIFLKDWLYPTTNSQATIIWILLG